MHADMQIMMDRQRFWQAGCPPGYRLADGPGRAEAAYHSARGGTLHLSKTFAALLHRVLGPPGHFVAATRAALMDVRNLLEDERDSAFRQATVQGNAETLEPLDAPWILELHQQITHINLALSLSHRETP